MDLGNDCGCLEAGHCLFASANDQLLGHGLGLAIHFDDSGQLVEVVLANLEGWGRELATSANAVGFVVVDEQLGILGQLNNDAGLDTGGNFATFAGGSLGCRGYFHCPLGGATLDDRRVGRGGVNNHAITTTVAAVAAAAAHGVGGTIAAAAAHAGVVGTVAAIAAAAAGATVAGINAAGATAAGVNNRSALWGAVSAAAVTDGLVAKEEVRCSGRADQGCHDNGGNHKGSLQRCEKAQRLAISQTVVL